MSELRRQLELARDEHKRARYSGDLAADVFASTGSSKSWIWQSFVGAAAAAAIFAVALWIGNRPVQVPQVAVNASDNPSMTDTIDGVTSDEQQEDITFGGIAMVPMPGVPSVESDTDDSMPSMSFGMPSFPSLGDVLSEEQESGATSKETI